MQGIVDTWEKIERITIKLLIPLLAFSLGVSAVTGKSITIEPRSETEGYLLIMCAVVLLIIPIVQRIQKGRHG